MSKKVCTNLHKLISAASLPLQEEEEQNIGEAENGHGYPAAKTTEQMEEGKHAPQAGPKFGWIKGVLVGGHKHTQLTLLAGGRQLKESR